MKRYAIGGAVGATFYLEPVATLDVRHFRRVQTRAGPSNGQPAPDFRLPDGPRWRRRGRIPRPGRVARSVSAPTSPLVEEALDEAATVDVEGTPARVFTAEHLAAIALQTGRAKDKARLLQFVEAGALEPKRFQAILARHGLAGRWREFERTFLQNGT